MRSLGLKQPALVPPSLPSLLFLCMFCDCRRYPDFTEELYHDMLRSLVRDYGVLAYNHPDDMLALGAKASLMKLRGLPLFMEDTYL